MRFLNFIFFALSFFVAQAQYNCGVNPTDDQAQGIFEYRKHLLAKSPMSNMSAKRDSNDMFTIPIKVHIVADSSGAGQYSILTFLSQIEGLNDLYEPIGFHFYLIPEVNFIRDNRFIKVRGSFAENEIERMFGDMMYMHYYYGAINIYYTQGLGNLCGMAPFPSWSVRYEGRTGVLMSNSASCAGPGKKTLAHELGHHFDLLHPFQGWDSKSSQYSEYVTRALSVRNCETAGDGFCDTPADVLDYSCPYNGTHTDLRGDRYNPDVTLLMSYHSDACQHNFSEEQAAHMRFVLQNDTSRVAYLRNQISDFTEANATELFSSNNSEQIPVGQKFNFTWQAVDNADVYYFVLMTGNGSVVDQLVTTANSLEYEFKDSERGRILYWQVSPVRFGQPVNKATERRSVRIVAPATGVKDFESVQLSVFPNPISKGESLNLQMANLSVFSNNKAMLRVLGLNGQIIQEYIFNIKSTVHLPLNKKLDAGVYLLNFIDGEDTYISKLVIQ